MDEHGCHTDRYVLGDPTYVEKLNMAYRESHVFKFADKVTVRFQCQIRLCLRVDDGCKGITVSYFLCQKSCPKNASLYPYEPFVQRQVLGTKITHPGMILATNLRQSTGQGIIAPILEPDQRCESE